MLARYLDEPEMPDVDLFVRSSGEQRTSNFLLWQSAYAELVFLDTLWPDFDRRHLWRAIETYARRDRRYGWRAGGPVRLHHVNIVVPTRRDRSAGSTSDTEVLGLRQVEKPIEGTTLGGALVRHRRVPTRLHISERRRAVMHDDMHFGRSSTTSTPSLARLRPPVRHGTRRPTCSAAGVARPAIRSATGSSCSSRSVRPSAQAAPR